MWVPREKSKRGESFCYCPPYIRPKLTQPKHSIHKYVFYAIHLSRSKFGFMKTSHHGETRKYVCSQCYKTFAGLYLQVSKHRDIFQLTCSQKYCQIHHGFDQKKVKKTTSILNLTILEATSDVKK